MHHEHNKQHGLELIRSRRLPTLACSRDSDVRGVDRLDHKNLDTLLQPEIRPVVTKRDTRACFEYVKPGRGFCAPE